MKSFKKIEQKNTMHFQFIRILPIAEGDENEERIWSVSLSKTFLANGSCLVEKIDGVAKVNEVLSSDKDRDRLRGVIT